MIDDLIGTAAASLLSQGTGWVIAVITGAVAFFFDKRNAELQEKITEQNGRAEEAVRQQYERRIEEFREIFDVMTEHTNTMKSMHGSVSATTEAINQLATGFAKLLREIENDKNVWGGRSEQLSKQLEDVRSRLEELQRNVRV